MGCGPTDAVTITGFLELPGNTKAHRLMATIEKSMGLVQEGIMKRSHADALEEEVKMSKQKNDLEYHICNIKDTLVVL